jgi:hypothetical protein
MFRVARYNYEFTIHLKKKDSKITSGLFINYLEKSKGYKFYYCSHNTRIIETENVRFIENDKVSKSEKTCNMKI